MSKKGTLMNRSELLMKAVLIKRQMQKGSALNSFKYTWREKQVAMLPSFPRGVAHLPQPMSRGMAGKEHRNRN